MSFEGCKVRNEVQAEVEELKYQRGLQVKISKVATQKYEIQHILVPSFPRG
jgi:hypothetical protein